MRKFRRRKGPPKYPIYPKYRSPAKHIPNYSETQVLPQNQSWIHQPSDSYLFRGDHNCSYNIFPYKVDSETEIVINGRYPYATYFSLTVIGQFNQLVDSAVDHELIPDPGSTNPFLPGANWGAKNRNYTLKIRFTDPPKGSPRHFVPESGNNIIYAGTLANGEPNIQGLIVLRIYVASIGYDKETGGVGFPTITYRATRDYKGHLTYARVEKQNISHGPTGSHDTSQQNINKRKQKSFNDYFGFNNDTNVHTRSDQDMNGSHICDLTWRTLSQISEAIHPDANTVYIISDQIHRQPDRLLFIRWKAPTFPDTYHNIGITGNEDMRYWSMTFLTPVGIIGLYTLGDFQAIIDDKGYVNLVISFGAPRPSCVTTENGFTWIDVSDFPLVPLVIEYRNNQISEDFPYTAKNLFPDETVPPEVMGKYYPCGKYVNPIYFDCWNKSHFETYCDDCNDDDWEE